MDMETGRLPSLLFQRDTLADQDWERRGGRKMLSLRSTYLKTAKSVKNNYEFVLELLPKAFKQKLKPGKDRNLWCPAQQLWDRAHPQTTEERVQVGV